MGSSRSKKTFNNMMVSLMYNIISFVMRFLMRRFFLEAFGLEILGYNSTFNSILGMLNLAELGVGIAITYKLYEPVANQDYKQINRYFSIYKKLYQKIGLFILCMGILLVPSLPLILKESYDGIAYLGIIFILQLLSTVATYWFAYKRIIFSVYQESYIASLIDIVFFIVANILQLIDLLVWKSYVLYLLIAVVQVVGANISVTIYGNKRYPELQEKNNIVSDKMTFGDMKADLKNVFAAKLGGYVLNSTDAVVVSAIMGSVYTGYMTNYTTVFISFQNIVLIALSTVQPSLGNKIVCEKNPNGIEKTIFNVTYMCQIIGSVFSIVAFFLIEDFIMLWIGQEYILDTVTATFFAINVYIFIFMYPISLLFEALGYFKYDKIFVSIAAVVNIFFSIIFVDKLGIAGVLIGTTVALLIYWVSRTFILYKRYYGYEPTAYIFKIIRCLVIDIVAILLICLVNSFFREVSIGLFLFKGVIYSVIVFIINVIFYSKTDEIKYFRDYFKRAIKK